VVYENARTLESVDVLKSEDWNAFGSLLCRSHKSLRDLIEGKGKELDALYSAQLKSQKRYRQSA